MNGQIKAPPFVKYPEIPYLETTDIFEGPVSVFEKINGSNCQVRKYGGRIFPGNRSNYVSNRRWDDLKGYKSWISDFKKWAMGNYSLYSLPEEAILFGEWNQRRQLACPLENQQVTYPLEFQDKFFMIDVGLISKSNHLELLDHEGSLNLCKELHLENILPIPHVDLPSVKRQELETILLNGLPGKIATSEMEGVVIRDYTIKPPRYRKLLIQPYSEIKNVASETRRYVNTPRMRKAVHRLLERGLDELDINPEVLFGEVREDIVSETGKEPDANYLSYRVIKFIKSFL